jgi:hypothetical protein
MNAAIDIPQLLTIELAGKAETGLPPAEDNR